MANMLSGLFEKKTAQEAPIGSGLADMARTTILKKQYKDHVSEAKATGEEPMTYEEFIKSRQSS